MSAVRTIQRKRSLGADPEGILHRVLIEFIGGADEYLTVVSTDCGLQAEVGPGSRWERVFTFDHNLDAAGDLPSACRECFRSAA